MPSIGFGISDLFGQIVGPRPGAEPFRTGLADGVGVGTNLNVPMYVDAVRLTRFFRLRCNIICH